MGASVRARLLALARRRRQPFDLMLTRYALERLLYRLGISRFRDRFVLKGAMLMTTWFDVPFRPTRDLDLLGYGDPEAEGMLGIFAEVCAIEADDGIVLDSKGFTLDRIRDELEYGGLRLRTNADIGGESRSTSASVTQPNRGSRNSTIPSCSTTPHHICAPTHERRLSPKSSRQR